MSWKFVFNGGNLIGKTILDIADAAHEGGYDFSLLMVMFTFVQKAEYIKRKSLQKI